MGAELVIGAFIVGILAGILSAVQGFLASSEKFNSRKFATGLITGALAGLAIGVAEAGNPVFNDPAVAFGAVLIEIGIIFLAAQGVDYNRNKIATMLKPENRTN